MKRRFVIGIIAVIVGFTAPVLAEAPKPYPDFTFRRVKPPKKGTTRRITIQIDPEAQRARLAATATGDRPQEKAADTRIEKDEDSGIAKIPALTGLEWYWAGVSPKLEDSGPGRLATALEQLKNAPEGKAVPVPRLQMLQDIAARHGADILSATVGTNVSPALVLAVIGVESSGKIDARSGAGAQGLMQLMPDTAKRFGVDDSSAASDNIKGGVAYLDWLMKEFNGDIVLVLAGYNAGENAVKDNGGVPPYAETRAYIPKVLAAWTVARGLCLTPPELVSDGCVFAVNRSASNG